MGRRADDQPRGGALNRSATWLLLPVFLIGCGGAPSGSDTSGSDLIVGTTAEEFGLLTIPRGGGPAAFRTLLDPDSVVWTGATAFPVASDVRVIDASTVVVIGERGRVSRFDPSTDELTEVARVSPGSRFSGTSGAAVALVDDSTDTVFRIGVDSVDETEIGQAVSWAGPVLGGLAVVLASDPPVLRILRDGQTEPVLEREVGAPTAQVSAWGRAVAVEEAGGGLAVFAADDGSLVQEISLNGRMRAIAASPSTHEIYVGIDDPPRLVRANRISGATRKVGDFRADLEQLRPSLFGGTIVVAATDGVGSIAPGDPTWRGLPGTWRSDLPFVLPDGRAIVLVDDEARLVDGSDAGARVLAGGAPAWWLPVRWVPRAVRTAASATDPAPAAEVPDSAAVTATPEPDLSGHYAIVASAGQRDGVEALLSSLRTSGYQTRLQEFADEAGRTWYRGLVGPYPTRARAQAAARQLGRERNLQAWVTEVRDDQ